MTSLISDPTFADEPDDGTGSRRSTWAPSPDAGAIRPTAVRPAPRAWTAAEEATLREHYGAHGPAWCAAALRRTLNRTRHPRCTSPPCRAAPR